MEYRPMVTRMLIRTPRFATMKAIPVRVPRDWHRPQGWVISFESEFSSFAATFGCRANHM